MAAKNIKEVEKEEPILCGQMGHRYKSILQVKYIKGNGHDGPDFPILMVLLSIPFFLGTLIMAATFGFSLLLLIVPVIFMLISTLGFFRTRIISQHSAEFCPHCGDIKKLL